MEQLPSLGTEISNIVRPTFGIYRSLLQKQADRIKSTSCVTHSYGSHPRQNLDIYTPSADAKPVTGNANSIFVFLYGGGLVNGDKCDTHFFDGLVYANLGHYFAENLGFETIILDYRLISHGAVFPSGGEDLSLALDWIINMSKARSSSTPLDIYIMGNSAGGIHVSTYLLSPAFAHHRDRITLKDSSSPAQLRGTVLLSVPFHFARAASSRVEVLRAYYGNDIERLCPLGLLRAANETRSIDNLRQVPVLVVKDELDPEDEILIPTADFIGEWRKKDSVSARLRVQMIEGHNHISPVLGLGTGLPREEAWGKQIIDFVISCSVD